MEKLIIIFVSLLIVLNYTKSVSLQVKPRGLLFKEPLDDYDVKKKVILTPVNRTSLFYFAVF